MREGLRLGLGRDSISFLHFAAFREMCLNAFPLARGSRTCLEIVFEVRSSFLNFSTISFIT